MEIEPVVENLVSQGLALCKYFNLRNGRGTPELPLSH